MLVVDSNVNNNMVYTTYIMLYVNYISIKLGKQKNTVEILSLLKELGQFFSWILREVS